MKFGINFPVIQILYIEFKYINRFDALLFEKYMKMIERNQMKSLVVKPPKYHGFGYQQLSK